MKSIVTDMSRRWGGAMMILHVMTAKEGTYGVDYIVAQVIVILIVSAIGFQNLLCYRQGDCFTIFLRYTLMRVF